MGGLTARLSKRRAETRSAFRRMNQSEASNTAVRRKALRFSVLRSYFACQPSDQGGRGKRQDLTSTCGPMKRRAIKEILKPNLYSQTKKLVYAGLILTLGFLQGCATTNSGVFEHGIKVSNFGKEWVYDVKIQYGENVIPAEFLIASNPNGGFGWNAPMPIPDEMTITWHTEKIGPGHRTIIQLKNKLSDRHQLANWKIRFYGSRVELWREVKTGPLNPHTMLWPREEQKVFP